MAFVTSTVQPAQEAATGPQDAGSNVKNTVAPLLGTLLLAAVAAQKSKKEFRKLKRRFLWTAFKLKAKSLFSKRAEGLSRTTIIYILLGVALIVLLIVAPVVALVLAIIALILLLTHTI
jgi:hypothetical protein